MRTLLLTATAALLALPAQAQYYVGGCGFGNCQGTQGPLQLPMQPVQPAVPQQMPGTVYSSGCNPSGGCGTRSYPVYPPMCCGTVYVAPRPAYRYHRY